SAPGKDRDFSSVQIDKVDQSGAIELATATLIQNDYKLIWYFGYEQIKPNLELIELYNIAEDSEELNDLSTQRKDIADEFLAILKSKLKTLDQSYHG
ncbi:MAG: hypothetical protein U9Q82_08285, partial [Chloroflexota bacterium]|nr:hypothetical protein [Chloroflexota bacterium]